MDKSQFDAARFALINLPIMNTSVNRANNRDEFEAKLLPLLKAFGERTFPRIAKGEYGHLPLWIFDDYLLAEAFDESYRSAGVPLHELRNALKVHAKKLDRAKLKAAQALDELISLSVEGPHRTSLEQAAELIKQGPSDGVIQPHEAGLFFAALVCLSFHYCFGAVSFNPEFDQSCHESRDLKPIARIVAVFYEESKAIQWLNSISSKVKRQGGEVAPVLSKIISEHFGLWGQFMNTKG